jgi:hypothetical protein
MTYGNDRDAKYRAAEGDDMIKYTLAIVLATLVSAAGVTAHAADSLFKVQGQSPSAMIVGTWQMGEQSGLQTYTFRDNGTYTYLGVLRSGGDVFATKKEEGTYQAGGDRLVIARQRGVFSTGSGSRNLEPETRSYRLVVGNTEIGPALKLVWSNGEAEIFYRR